VDPLDCRRYNGDLVYLNQAGQGHLDPADMDKFTEEKLAQKLNIIKIRTKPKPEPEPTPEPEPVKSSPRIKLTMLSQLQKREKSPINWRNWSSGDL
jgi:hypothetical protein